MSSVLPAAPLAIQLQLTELAQIILCTDVGVQNSGAWRAQKIINDSYTGPWPGGWSGDRQYWSKVLQLNETSGINC